MGPRKKKPPVASVDVSDSSDMEKEEHASLPVSPPAECSHSGEVHEKDENEENEDDESDDSEPERTKKKEKEKVSDDDDGSGTHAGLSCYKERLSLWEDAILRAAMEMFGWSNEFTRLKMAAMEPSTRDSMAKKWIEIQVKLEKAIINRNHVEGECLKTIFPSTVSTF